MSETTTEKDECLEATERIDILAGRVRKKVARLKEITEEEKAFLCEPATGT